jgi:hypothetical protein
MKLTQIDLKNRKQVRDFLSLPFSLYRDNPQWVPPFASDAALYLNPEKHPFFRHSQGAFFVAYDDQGKPAGRLAVLDNRRFNDYNHESTAFFYFFECVNDREVSGALFEAAFAWSRQRGLNKILGPKGFTPMDCMGLLVRGFQYRPALGITYNLEYYPELVEVAGFQKGEDIISGFFDRSVKFPEKIHEVSKLVQERKGLRVARFTKRSQLRMLVPKFKDMYNAALEGTVGNVPLTDEETQTIANQLLTFADPRLIKIIFKEETPVGFLFAYPDISAALQRTKGRLFPFGWVDVLLEFRRTKWMNINGAGIAEKYRGMGGTAILFSEMAYSVLTSQFEFADVVQIGSDNERMLNELRTIGIDFYKAHRMYHRDL